MVLSYQNHINRYEYDMNHTHTIDTLTEFQAHYRLSDLSVLQIVQLNPKTPGLVAYWQTTGTHGLHSPKLLWNPMDMMDLWEIGESW